MRHGPGSGVRRRFFGAGRATSGAAVELAAAEPRAMSAQSSRGGTTWMSSATIEVTIASPKIPPKTAVMRGERWGAAGRRVGGTAPPGGGSGVVRCPGADDERGAAGAPSTSRPPCGMGARASTGAGRIATSRGTGVRRATGGREDDGSRAESSSRGASEGAPAVWPPTIAPRRRSTGAARRGDRASKLAAGGSTESSSMETCRGSLVAASSPSRTPSASGPGGCPGARPEARTTSSTSATSRTHVPAPDSGGNPRLLRHSRPRSGLVRAASGDR